MRNCMRHYVVTTIFFLLAIDPRYTFACSCSAEPPVMEEFASCKAVFSGRVLSRSKIVIAPAELGGFEEVSFTFLVDRVWKGQLTTQVDVATGVGGGDCGFLFEEGEEYLVYAFADEESLATNICTRTRPISLAFNDIKELGPPTANIGADGSSYGDAVRLIAIISAALILITSSMLFIARRKRQLP
jgi:hypothetical protein